MLAKNPENEKSGEMSQGGVHPGIGASGSQDGEDQGGANLKGHERK